MLEKNKERNPRKKQKIGKYNGATNNRERNVPRILASEKHHKMREKSEILWATPKPPLTPTSTPEIISGFWG
jgi:hypothetical protein